MKNPELNHTRRGTFDNIRATKNRLLAFLAFKLRNVLVWFVSNKMGWKVIRFEVICGVDNGNQINEKQRALSSA